MRSSDTPATRGLLPHDSPDLLRGEQGESDWSRQPFSDDLLSDEAKERLRIAFEEWQDAHS